MPSTTTAQKSKSPKDDIRELLHDSKRAMYSLNVSSDHIHQSDWLDRQFEKLVSIVTLKLDRALLGRHRTTTVPKDRRTGLVLFPESRAKARKENCINHLHGFMTLPDIEMTPFEELKAMSQFCDWLQFYALKLEIIRPRNAKNHKVGKTFKIEEENMQTAMADYALLFREENDPLDRSIFFGANLFTNPFS